MSNIYLNDSIEKLGLDNKIEINLLKNKIILVQDLWNLTRKYLKKMGFYDDQIN